MQNGAFWRRKLQSANFKIENVEFNSELWFRTPSLIVLVGFQGGGESSEPLETPPLGYGYADGMIKGGITQIEMAQRIAYPYSHLVSFIQLSRGFFYPITILLYTCYLSLITMSICNLRVDWKSLDPFNLWRLIQILSWIPFLAVASVEIAPFEELYKYDRKTEKNGCWFDPSAHHYLPNTVCLQTTFLLETSCQNDIYGGKHEDPMEFTSLRQGFHN